MNKQEVEALLLQLCKEYVVPMPNHVFNPHTAKAMKIGHRPLGGFVWYKSESRRIEANLLSQGVHFQKADHVIILMRDVDEEVVAHEFFHYLDWLLDPKKWEDKHPALDCEFEEEADESAQLRARAWLEEHGLKKRQ